MKQHPDRSAYTRTTWAAHVDPARGTLETLEVVGPFGASDVATLLDIAPQGAAHACLLDFGRAPPDALGIAAGLALDAWLDIGRVPGRRIAWISATTLGTVFATALAERHPGLSAFDDIGGAASTWLQGRAPRAAISTGIDMRLARLQRWLWENPLEEPECTPALDADGELRGRLELHGTTLSRERQRTRIDMAIERLWGGHDKLASIASELGFSSESRFGRIMHEHTGLTPGELRERRAELAALRPLARRTPTWSVTLGVLPFTKRARVDAVGELV